MKLSYFLGGVAVNFIWGLAFLVPYYLSDINPTLIVLSRYFFYGLISVLVLFARGGHWRSLTRLDWQKAMLFAFTGNIGYYFALACAIHYAGIALPTLIVGALPITMMVYANFKNKEFAFRQLLLPMLLILIGIVSLKWFQYRENTLTMNLSDTLIGAAWALVSLSIWTWFGVANADYLKKHFTISGQTWSLAIGACCLIQVMILFPIVFITNKTLILTSLQHTTTLYQIILGGLILGVIVSWFATGLWNKISRQLPTTIVGQLLVFETIASLTYGYILDKTFPPFFILISIAIVLLGIVLSIRLVNQRMQ